MYLCCTSAIISGENYETCCYRSKLNSGCSTSLFDIDSITEWNVNLLSRYVAKPIYWYQFVLKESTGSQARRMGSSCSRDLNSLMAFREEFLKTGLGRGSWVCDQHLHNSLIGWWWGNRKMFWESQFSGSSWSGVYMLVVSIQLTSTWWGFSICRTTQGYGSGYYLQPLRSNKRSLALFND